MAGQGRGDPFSPREPESHMTKTISISSSRHPDHFSSQRQSVISSSVAFQPLYGNFSSFAFANVGVS
jgi:hypothetical protein